MKNSIERSKLIREFALTLYQGNSMCFDELIEQVIYDFRKDCANRNIDLEKLLENSKTPFKGFDL